MGGAEKNEQEMRLLKFRNLELFELLVAEAERVCVNIYDPKSNILSNKNDIINFVKKLISGIDEHNRAVIEILSSVEFGNRYVSHSLKVTIFSIIIGKLFNFTEGVLFNLAVAAFLHDIGKARSNNQFINSYFKNVNDEKEINMYHPEVGAEIVGQYFGFGSEIAQIVLRHHEQPDGGGFPDGLREGQLTFSDKIVFTANFIDNVLHKTDYAGTVSILPYLKNVFTKHPEKFDDAIANYVLVVFAKPVLSKRGYERFFMTLPASFSRWQEYAVNGCRLLDLSGSGARIRTREMLQEGEQIRLSFTLSGVISFNGKECVVRRTEADGEANIYGLEFQDRGQFQEKMNEYLKKYIGKSGKR